MRKVIILSVNDNPIYLFTLPLVVWSWLRIGWMPIIMFQGEPTEITELVQKRISDFGENVIGVTVENIDGYRSETVAQVSRLYGACVMRNAYLITGDADMMALSDYWKFDPKKITIWGHDLTNFQQMPICYIGMTSERWTEVMGINSPSMIKLIKRDLELMPDAGENGNQVDRWCTDQRLITQKINEVNFEKEFITRGTLYNGYPIGRIDRSAWATYHPNPVDCHLPHDIYSNDETFAKVMRMLASIFPQEKFYWFAEYTEKFKKLANG